MREDKLLRRQKYLFAVIVLMGIRATKLLIETYDSGESFLESIGVMLEFFLPICLLIFIGGAVAEAVFFLEGIYEKKECISLGENNLNLDSQHTLLKSTYKTETTLGGGWICPQCKEENGKESIFCTSCGSHR